MGQVGQVGQVGQMGQVGQVGQMGQVHAGVLKTTRCYCSSLANIVNSVTQLMGQIKVL